LLKRYNISISQIITMDALTINHKTYEVFYDEEKADLPQKEFRLLYSLARYPGKTLPRAELIDDIRGYDYEGDERTVDVYIKRLRKLFADDATFKIKAVRGLGYRLEALT